MPCFRGASEGSTEAKASKLHSTSKKNLLLFYSDLYVVPTITLPATGVQESSHGLRRVKSPEPTPKQRCYIQLSSPPYTLQGNSLRATREPLSLPGVKPGEHHKLIKKVEFTAYGEMHHFPCSQEKKSLPHGSSQGSFHHVVWGGFKGLSDSSVRLERNTTALTGRKHRSSA